MRDDEEIYDRATDEFSEPDTPAKPQRFTSKRARRAKFQQPLDSPVSEAKLAEDIWQFLARVSELGNSGATCYPVINRAVGQQDMFATLHKHDKWRFT